MTDWLNPAQDAALRQIEPPPMSGDFAERLMARLPMTVAVLPKSGSTRARRRPWQKARTALVAGAAFGLISISAAASGLFGVSVRNMPVIGTFVERVSPAAPPKRVIKPIIPAKKGPSRMAPISVPTMEPLPPVRSEVILSPDIRREAFAERIAQKMEQRAARRAALGLPPQRRPLPPHLRERLKAMEPEQRRALMKRVRDIRREQRRSALAAEGGPSIQPDPEIGQRRPQLTPEQRERRRAFRRMMMERRAADTGQPPQ
jgi:hypothetical protein